MVYLFLYACFCVFFAHVNSEWIKNDRAIKHFWNGLIHVSSAVLGGYFFGWKLGLSVLIVARLVFDTALNLLRGLPLDYVSPKPKSIVDKVEKYLFKLDAFTPKIIYLALLICLQIL